MKTLFVILPKIITYIFGYLIYIIHYLQKFENNLNLVVRNFSFTK